MTVLKEPPAHHLSTNACSLNFKRAEQILGRRRKQSVEKEIMIFESICVTIMSYMTFVIVKDS